MTIIAAVTDGREGHLALVEGIAEARRLRTDLVAVNLSTTTPNLGDLDTEGVFVTVVDRRGAGKEDSADAVLDEITAHEATRLVIGVRRRTPVGKVLLGSMSQWLLLHSPVPVLAVKLPADELQSGPLDALPPGMRRVTG